MGEKKEKKEEKEKKESFNAVERAWKILEYLRKHTDENHRISQQELKKALGPYFKDNNDTIKSDVFRLAQALNGGEEGQVLPSEAWKICYKAYQENYGGEDGLDKTEDEEDMSEKERKRKERRDHSLPVRQLYYRHTFSYSEINALIDALQFSRTLSTQEIQDLIKKVEENLTTNFYKKGPKNICTVRESMPMNQELRENLLKIQRAIDDGVQISFFFNGYDRYNNLKPVRDKKKDTVSPYYIVANNGRYYLLACDWEWDNMSIWRIDLMRELEVARGEADKPLRVKDKEDVRNLPQKWIDNFSFQHLNMDFDPPLPVKLRIYPGKHPETGYTFLHDSFGGSFRYVRTEKEPPYGDIVQVASGSFSIVNWALQYADRVEVLEPKKVREEVKKKLRTLNQRYGLDE